MVNVGVIGAGLMGSTHARLLATAVSGAEVVAISDAVHDTPTRVAEELGARRSTPTALELIADPAVDAVVIASPAATHEPFALACLAGRQAGAVREAARGLRRGRDADRRGRGRASAAGSVTVGFMRRYDPGYADLKARLDAGAIGAPLLVHCAHRNPSVHPFFDSAMIITDTAVHEIDITRWLLGEEIVRATVLTPRRVPRARRACATRSSSSSRPRAAGSSTSRRSSPRATATTSAARSWGRTGRSSCCRRATVAAARATTPRRSGDPAGLPGSASPPRTSTSCRPGSLDARGGSRTARAPGTATRPPRSARRRVASLESGRPVDVAL